jgi:hypothetical protein
LKEKSIKKLHSKKTAEWLVAGETRPERDSYQGLRFSDAVLRDLGRSPLGADAFGDTLITDRAFVDSKKGRSSAFSLTAKDSEDTLAFSAQTNARCSASSQSALRRACPELAEAAPLASHDRVSWAIAGNLPSLLLPTDRPVGSFPLFPPKIPNKTLDN